MRSNISWDIHAPKTEEDRKCGKEGGGKNAYPSSAEEHEPGVLDLSGPLHPFVGGL